MTTDTITTFPFIKSLETGRHEYPDAFPDWYRQWRAARWQSFLTAGWPTIRDEDWKYTDLSTLRDTAVAMAADAGAMDAALISKLCDPREISVVFFNGRYQPALSGNLAGIEGLRIQSFADALGAGDAALRALLTATPDDPAQP